MGLTEKQYKHILSKLSEQSEAEPVSATPEAGTSSTQAGGTGYPEVGKWESGVSRGPANQVGVTKWSDVVGSKLTRSKANQLKEQYWPNPNDTKINKKITIPKGQEAHTANSAAALIIGLIPHPVAMILSGLIMAQDATQYNKEGDSKNASLGYIFAAIGLFTPIAKIPYIKQLGAKGMIKIGEKLSQGVKLLPEENVIVKKIIQNKDMISQVLKKVAERYKNTKFSKSKIGKVINKSAPTLGLYGGIMAAHNLGYDALTADERAKQEQIEIDNLEKLNNSVGNEKSEQPIKRKN